MIIIYNNKIQKNKYSIAIQVIAGICLLVGLSVIIGWIFDIESLKSVVKGFNSMKFNTALFITLLSTSLFLHANKMQWHKMIYVSFCSIVACFGFISLLFMYGQSILKEKEMLN